MEGPSKVKILIGCTGSVATIKVPAIADKLKSLNCSVIIVPTANAIHFLLAQAEAEKRALKPEYISQLCLNCSKGGIEKVCKECKLKLYYHEHQFVFDKEEWESWKGRGDEVVHISLRKWADILLLAPLDANTLSKVANGACDNLLTCVVRAWDFKKSTLFCPAMNTQMYIHPVTSKHISTLKEWGFEEIESMSKTLMCGDRGIGAMAEVDVIVTRVSEILAKLKENDSLN